MNAQSLAFLISSHIILTISTSAFCYVNPKTVEHLIVAMKLDDFHWIDQDINELLQEGNVADIPSLDKLVRKMKAFVPILAKNKSMNASALLDKMAAFLLRAAPADQNLVNIFANHDRTRHDAAPNMRSYLVNTAATKPDLIFALLKSEKRSVRLLAILTLFDGRAMSQHETYLKLGDELKEYERFGATSAGLTTTIFQRLGEYGEPLKSYLLNTVGSFFPNRHLSENQQRILSLTLRSLRVIGDGNGETVARLDSFLTTISGHHISSDIRSALVKTREELIAFGKEEPQADRTSQTLNAPTSCHHMFRHRLN